MKVAVTDFTFPDLSIEEEILRAEGHEIVAWKEKRPAAELAGLLANAEADAVLVQFAPVDASVIAAMPKTRVIVRYGIGVDNVDLDAAKERGIPVCNVPDYCVDEVADHTLAFILATTRQVVPHCVKLREGGWGLATPLDQLRAMRDLTIGVVGFGRIGREVVARLKPFKSRILVHDPFAKAEDLRSEGVEPADLPGLLAASDVVTLHCPSNASTRGLINRESLALMKPTAVLINLARGDLADPDALTDALREGKIAGAALDVFAPEPIPAGHAILGMANVVLAPHIASASVPAVRKLRETVARIAAAALRGEPLPNVVNGVGQR